MAFQRVLVMTTATLRSTSCKKRYLYFTLACRNCVYQFSTHIGLKIFSGLICNDNVQFKKKTRKLAIAVCVFQNAYDFEIRCCSTEDGKEMHNVSKRTCRTIAGDVPVAVVIVVC